MKNQSVTAENTASRTENRKCTTKLAEITELAYGAETIGCIQQEKDY
ncbi:MAG: hypothetical protein NC548_58860 [Lachnospiraceae bacterium]|nr:hypothetical protein [Lachnospiraceae bacterium]